MPCTAAASCAALTDPLQSTHRRAPTQASTTGPATRLVSDHRTTPTRRAAVAVKANASTMQAVAEPRKVTVAATQMACSWDIEDNLVSGVGGCRGGLDSRQAQVAARAATRR